MIGRGDLPVPLPRDPRAYAPRSRFAGAAGLAALVLLGAIVGSGAGVANRVWPATQVTPIDTPTLTLVSSPAIGNSPLAGNVSATAAGGVAPYSLSLCFGTADHSSATPNCAPRVSNWSGTGPLEFPFRYAAPGNYSVVGIATDAHGAGVGSTILIVVTSGSVLEVYPSETVTSGSAPLPVTLQASVLGGTPPLTIQWQFGDGSSGSSVPGGSVNHTYASAGTFTPRLIVTDAAGHQVTRTLPSVVVGAPSGGGGSVPVDSAGTLELIGLFAAVVGAVAIAARLWQVRRWREEGNAIVDEMLGTEEPPRPPFG